MSNIVCSKCGLPVSGARVNIATGLAHCEPCDRVFRFDDQITPPHGVRRSTSSRSDSSSSTALALAMKPERFVVTGGELAPPEEVMYRTKSTAVTTPLVIRWRWLTPSAFFFIAFAIAWDSFLVFWYANALAHGGPTMMFVFPLAHVAAGLWITYGALSRLLNSTTITVGAEEIRSVTSPIRNPFDNETVVHRDAVVEVGVVEKKGSKGSVSYAVVARDDAGRAHKLARLDLREEADYLTQRIRKEIEPAAPTREDEALTK